MLAALFIGNDLRVRWDEMTDELSDPPVFVNDATVSFTLKDSAGLAVSGASGVSMPYVTGSDGRYQAKLSGAVSLSAGSMYYLEISATATGRIGFRRIPARAQYTS